MNAITIVSAGLSRPSSTLRLAEAIAAQFPGEKISTVEIRELLPDLAQAMAGGGLSAPLEQAISKLVDAHALIIATPVMKASYSGMLKLFFDVLDPSLLQGKPVVLAATGGSGRHALMLDHAMRPLLNFMRATVVPTGVFATAEDLASLGTGGELDTRIGRAAEELGALMPICSARASAEVVSAGA
ncbi:CE1759 family FMN reductase [Corynebacterium pseudopelargi]|uniref:FMN reductase (NADPH) n=1 Tax=Corynebacterium pseudopelargi TaxID=2080757 RepID=A0A3G6IRK6_9CORY|nr:CE1759 family FMN reductase [Corynebacterium pseudopelargi]AZA08219.1 FMN reductase (NADPH) [Corynebacterium pseudopelargi]